MGCVLYAHVTRTFVWGASCTPQTRIFGKLDPFSAQVALSACPKRKLSSSAFLKCAPNANLCHPFFRDALKHAYEATSASLKTQRFAYPQAADLTSRRPSWPHRHHTRGVLSSSVSWNSGNSPNRHGKHPHLTLVLLRFSGWMTPKTSHYHMHLLRIRRGASYESLRCR